MILPPLRKSGDPFLGSVKFDLAMEGDRSGSIEIRDDSGGAFVVLRSDGPEGLAFDPDELSDVAKWAKKLCAEVTRFNGTEVTGTLGGRKPIGSGP